MVYMASMEQENSLGPVFQGNLFNMHTYIHIYIYIFIYMYIYIYIYIYI
jgi:hypothetical protein